MWEANARRCFYCGDPVRFRDMELDHIVPQSLVGEALYELLETAGLPRDWDLQDYSNIVPACRPCNRSKRALLPRPAQIVLLTTRAAARAPVVRTLEDKYRRDAGADRVRALLEGAIGGGILTREDVDEMLIGVASRAAAVRLSSPVDFIDVAISELTEQDVDRLRQQPLRAGAISMEFPGGERRDVASVAEYEQARREGAYPPTATDMRREGALKRASAIFRAVAMAQPPERSFISRPHVGVCDIDLLPSSLLEYLGTRECWDKEWQPLRERLPTIGAFVGAGYARIVAVDSSYVRVRPTEQLHLTDGVFLETGVGELLRADLDSDGVEDILVATYGRAVGGSHGHSSEPVVLSRHEAGGIFVQSAMMSDR
jgi:hypothetical protein